MKPSAAKLDHFRKTIYDYFKAHRRSLSWRDTRTPYKILVSEVMLQQTQVHRVIAKYEQFMQIFPDFATLAQSPLSRVLSVWSGLGYNRRALYLKKIAEIIITKYNGTLPDSVEQLDELPGIAHATACSILAFSFNKPVVFIETNIRSVFIHFFFHDKTNIQDKEILPLIEVTLDQTNPREWYYALMDYGAMLKKQHPNPSRKSAHHVTQSKFEGSTRQLRGAILKALLTTSPLSKNKLYKITDTNPAILTPVLKKMEQDGLIFHKKLDYAIVEKLT